MFSLQYVAIQDPWLSIFSESVTGPASLDSKLEQARVVLLVVIRDFYLL